MRLSAIAYWSLTVRETSHPTISLSLLMAANLKAFRLIIETCQGLRDKKKHCAFAALAQRE